MSSLFRRILQRYPRSMGIARQPQERIRPVPRLAELDQWENHWVAVKEGKVIAAAETSRELAYRLREMGDAGKGAVLQFVRPNADSYVIGAG